MVDIGHEFSSRLTIATSREGREFGPLTDATQPIRPDQFADLSGKEYRIGIVTGVNGAGKTTTTRQLTHDAGNELGAIKRHTTKDLRPGDDTYKSVTEEEFTNMLAGSEFVDAALYGPGYYGTSVTETKRALGASSLAVCEMDPVASLLFKDRMRKVGNVSVSLYFLNPFENEDMTPEEKLRYMQKRTGRNIDVDGEELSRLIKSATHVYDLEPFDRRVSVAGRAPDDVAKEIYRDLAR